MVSFPSRVFKLVLSCFGLNRFVPYDRSYLFVLYDDPSERIDMSEQYSIDLASQQIHSFSS
jgi:hypothetical protein